MSKLFQSITTLLLIPALFGDSWVVLGACHLSQAETIVSPRQDLQTQALADKAVWMPFSRVKIPLIRNRFQIDPNRSTAAILHSVGSETEMIIPASYFSGSDPRDVAHFYIAKESVLRDLLHQARTKEWIVRIDANHDQPSLQWISLEIRRLMKGIANPLASGAPPGIPSSLNFRGALRYAESHGKGPEFRKAIDDALSRSAIATGFARQYGDKGRQYEVHLDWDLLRRKNQLNFVARILPLGVRFEYIDFLPDDLRFQWVAVINPSLFRLDQFHFHSALLWDLFSAMLDRRVPGSSHKIANGLKSIRASTSLRMLALTLIITIFYTLVALVLILVAATNLGGQLSRSNIGSAAFQIIMSGTMPLTITLIGLALYRSVSNATRIFNDRVYSRGIEAWFKIGIKVASYPFEWVFALLILWSGYAYFMAGELSKSPIIRVAHGHGYVEFSLSLLLGFSSVVLYWDYIDVLLGIGAIIPKFQGIVYKQLRRLTPPARRFASLVIVPRTSRPFSVNINRMWDSVEWFLMSKIARLGTSQHELARVQTEIRSIDLHEVSPIWDNIKPALKEQLMFSFLVLYAKFFKGLNRGAIKIFDWTEGLRQHLASSSESSPSVLGRIIIIMQGVIDRVDSAVEIIAVFISNERKVAEFYNAIWALLDIHENRRALFIPKAFNFLSPLFYGSSEFVIYVFKLIKKATINGQNLLGRLDQYLIYNFREFELHLWIFAQSAHDFVREILIYRHVRRLKFSA